MEREVTYECEGRLEMGRANTITVRDNRGNVLGYYTGYWRRGVVALYPKAASVSYTGYKLYKHTVSDMLIKVK